MTRGPSNRPHRPPNPRPTAGAHIDPVTAAVVWISYPPDELPQAPIIAMPIAMEQLIGNLAWLASGHSWAICFDTDDVDRALADDAVSTYLDKIPPHRPDVRTLLEFKQIALDRRDRQLYTTSIFDYFTPALPDDKDI